MLRSVDVTIPAGTTPRAADSVAAPHSAPRGRRSTLAGRLG
jgi:hypothetical protein